MSENSQHEKTADDKTRPDKSKTPRRRLWIPILVFLFGLGVVGFSVFKYEYPLLDPSEKLKMSEPYKIAVEAIQADSHVKKHIGPAVAPTGYVDGWMERNECFLRFRLTGTKGLGGVHGKAIKSQGQWIFVKLEVNLIKDREHFDGTYDGKVILMMDPTGGMNGTPSWRSEEEPKTYKT
ncbi:MAG: hypothetical protein PVH19_02795 [Planctomycetia bacterium]|jgi:hypothetical protein